jgi:pilus assembly protein FimV
MPVSHWDLFCSRQNPGVLKLIAKSHRWQQTALAAAALFALWEPNAMALSLGRVTVLSALGEPLRAEVEVPDINAEEVASLKTAVASPAAFKAAGFDYNAAMSSLQATLHKRPDGRSYIRLSGEQAIHEPFVDMILEVSWASGRIVRDYTLLFDPPNLRPAAPITPTPAQVAAPQPGVRVVEPVRAPVPIAPTVVEPRKVAPAPKRSDASHTSGGGQINVKVGDTAGKIAATVKPPNVSLDQMLVALLRANPAAFISDNVNRIKAGSILTIPTAEQAEGTPTAEATHLIIAQSKDFNDFRQRLAEGATNAPVAAAESKASGSVQAKVEDKRAPAATPDKLTLSKGAIQKQQAEDQLAKERSAQDAANRAAEIAKNIQDLSKLDVASNAVTPAPKTTASTPAGPILASNAASAAAATGTDQRLLGELMENWQLPTAAIGILALLAFLGFRRSRPHPTAIEDEPVFPEELLRPESFVAASGGEQVDTHDSVASNSEIAFSPSQLGTASEVDPVAEADVYLAYGRDLQAEEILKGALRSNPERIAIHQKLLELFAKRRDLKAFDAIAELAFAACKGEGPDWERIRELGLSLDASNPLYQTGGQQGTAHDSAAGSTLPGPTANAADTTAQGVGTIDLDLDLDFSHSEVATDDDGETNASLAETAPGTLNLDLKRVNADVKATALPSAVADAVDNSIDFSLPDQNVVPAPAEPRSSPAAASTTSKFGMLDFDLDSLSLDLDDVPAADSNSTAAGQSDPLATKLALAEEFLIIGDVDGARALFEEVVAQASGDLKIKAQQALSKLSSA